MTDDDQPLAPYDLSAWEPPPPPAGLADRVIAVASQPVARAAIEPSVRGTTRSSLINLAAIAAIAALVFVAWAIVGRAPADGRGEVVATQAQELAIGPTRATLDPGTTVTWRRDGRRITATQRGQVTWNLDDDDTLVIDAGATVASVEAHGASLRVEVPMNPADARVIGVGSAAALVATLVTVVVYEGRARVTHDDRTVEVGAGAMYAVAPTPSHEDTVATHDEIARLRRQIAELEKERQVLVAELQGTKKTGGDRTVAAGTCDEVSCVLSDNAGACCAKYKKQPGACDADALTQKGNDHLSTGMDAAALAAFEQSMRCRPDAGLYNKAFLAACRSKNLGKARVYFDKLPAAKRDTLAAICIRNGIDPTVAARTCDAAALAKTGDDHLMTGQDAAALRAFEAASRCDPSQEPLVRKTFMAACRAKDQAAARRAYAKLPEKVRPQLTQICIRYGIDVR